MPTEFTNAFPLKIIEDQYLEMSVYTEFNTCFCLCVIKKGPPK